MPPAAVERHRVPGQRTERAPRAGVLAGHARPGRARNDQREHENEDGAAHLRLGHVLLGGFRDRREQRVEPRLEDRVRGSGRAPDRVEAAGSPSATKPGDFTISVSPT